MLSILFESIADYSVESFPIFDFNSSIPFGVFNFLLVEVGDKSANVGEATSFKVTGTPFGEVGSEVTGTTTLEGEALPSFLALSSLTIGTSGFSS